jgi:predicted GIY-YIG superfamily endonuclease
MKTGIIYIATNKITKKSYIGLSTKTLERRMKQHIRDSKRYKFKFYNALKNIESINLNGKYYTKMYH